MFVQHNYVFYTVQEACIIIVGIFNEKENFLWKLLKVSELEDENDALYDEETKKYFINESSPTYGYK